MGTRLNDSIIFTHPSMFTYLLTQKYKVLYIIPLVYALTLAYANAFYLDNLLESHELEKGRQLVTISAVFTYKFELRWMFYYITLVWAVIFGGHAPQIFVRYFCEDPEFRSSIKKSQKFPNGWITIFESTMIAGTFFNAGLVYFIKGEYPAWKAEIPEKLWTLHFVMIFGLLGNVAVSIYAFFRILEPASKAMKNQHSIVRKKILAALHFTAEITMFIAFAFKDHINFDYLVILEYLTILFFIFLYIDFFSGIEKAKS